MDRRTSSRRGLHQASALVLVGAILASACGSTSYRDRVELAAETGDSPTDLPTIAGPGSLADSATDAAANPSEVAATEPGDAATTGANPAESATQPGSTGSGGSGGSGTETGGPTTPDPAATTPTTTATAAPVDPGLPQSDVNGRGVSDTEVRVGVVTLTSFQNMGANLGFSVAEKGDTKKQVNDLANWINDNGGVAGRNIVPIVRIYTQEEASPGSEAQLCNAFADDDNVWAVMLYGQIHASTRECYAGKKILMLDPTPFTYDETLYNELSPYMWSPVFPNYSKIMRTLPGELAKTEFYDAIERRGETEMKIGVIHWDSPFARRVLERDLTPALSAVGQEITVSYGVDGSSVATIQNGLSNAITQFRANGVNRVFFIGGSPLAPFFFSNAESDGFRPIYGITSLDQPRHTASERGTPPQMVDAMGIGFNYDVDVEDEDVPQPATENERLCLQVLEANGHTFARRENSNYALAVCTTFMLLKRGAESITNGLTAEIWSVHAEQIGADFHPTLWFDTEFGPGNHDGTETYRPMRHFADCGCFHYTADASRFR